MSYGYSQSLVTTLLDADSEHLGITLGKHCVKLGIPVAEVADSLGVSRATVYNWFWGLNTPLAKHKKPIRDFIRANRKRR
jgi:transposase